MASREKRKAACCACQASPLQGPSRQGQADKDKPTRRVSKKRKANDHRVSYKLRLSGGAVASKAGVFEKRLTFTLLDIVDIVEAFDFFKQLQAARPAR